MTSVERGVLGAALLAAMTGLSGCSILSPMPLWELVKGGGAVATKTLEGLTPGKATATVTHEPVRSRQMCIEFNPNCQVGEIVPAIQSVLAERGIQSRVYEAGAPASLCEVWLNYDAHLQWDVPAFEKTARPFMERATLGLRSSTGRVLAVSRFEVDAGLTQGKWSSTRKKLTPVVTALLSSESR